MMKTQHPSLAVGRWKVFSLAEQLANVGSEVERTIKWQEKGNREYSDLAFVRALELLDLTIATHREFSRLKELTRLREVLVDYFKGENEYGSSVELWHNYFYPFTFTVRMRAGKA